MNPMLAHALLLATALYLALGVAFAIAFVSVGAGRVDPGAANASVGFRLLLLPGAAALWPLLARRWRDAGRGLPEQHDAHTDAARRARDGVGTGDGK